MPDFALVTAATGSVVSLADAKAHVREDADVTDHDPVITALVAAATDWVRAALGRAILPETWVATFDAAAENGDLLVPRPVASVTGVDVMQAGAYVAQDAATWVVRPRGSYACVVRPVRAAQAVAGVWPLADVDEAAYRVTYTDGWANAAAVPASIVAAIKLVFGDLFTNRDGSRLANVVDNPAVERLLAPWRLPVV